MLNNKVQIVGNVGRAPEIFTTESGKKILSFSVCINERYKKDDKLVEKTTWVPCVCFQTGRVDFLEKNLRSGAYLMVGGRLSENTYTSKKYFDAAGNPAINKELQLVVEEFLLIDSKSQHHETPEAPEPVPTYQDVAGEGEETGF